MRRHPHLQPLSREHHRALLCWRDLDQQLGGSDVGRTKVAAQALWDYANDQFLTHTADEEALFVDLLSDELRLRLLSEHEALRSLLDSVRQQLDATSLDIDELAKLATMWRAHIRWEERHLYPYLETHASPDALQLIGDRLHHHVRGASCSVMPDRLGTEDEHRATQLWRTPR